MHVKSLAVLAAGMLVGMGACGSGVLPGRVASEASDLAWSPDVVLQWNEIAVNTMVDAGTGPVPQVRFAAIAQLAVFESVNSITQRYEPYVGTFSAPPGASPEAAAVAAAHKVLVTYFAGKAASLDASYQASLGTIREGKSRDDGVALGEAVANAVVALRANDGSSPPKTKVPGPAVPGEYQATASCPIGPSGAKEGSFYHWQDVTPFAIATPKDFLLQPPPALASDRYARDYLEVLTVGSATSTERPQDRADVVHLYGSAGPAYLMNSVARQLAMESHGSLTENARTLALVNMAMNDGLITSLYNKYQYNFWRPETAIHAGDSDGNPRTPADPSFAPFIVTPCYPSYPSNQGTATNAALGIFRRVYGDRHHRISLSFPGVPGVTVTNTRLSQISSDVADARVYGGIHFRFDQVEGQRLGKRIARAVHEAVLRPLHRDQDDVDDDDAED
jgi:PAP2 superfamily